MGTNTNVLIDVNVTGHALGGSLCPEKACRAGFRHCGGRNCGNGVLNNGLGPVETIEDLSLTTFYGRDEHTNHALAALATVARQAKEGLVTYNVADYQETRLVKLLIENCDFTDDEARTVRKLHEVQVLRSNGTRVPVTDAKQIADAFTDDLSDQDWEFFYGTHPVQIGNKVEHRSLIDHEDTMVIAAMIAISEATDDAPVVLVTSDQGFLVAGRRLEQLFVNFRVVSPRDYVKGTYAHTANAEQAAA